MIVVPDQGGCGAGLVLLPRREDGNGGELLAWGRSLGPLSYSCELFCNSELNIFCFNFFVTKCIITLIYNGPGLSLGRL